MSAASTRETLWRQLTEAGLAQGDLPAHDPATSPWYVRTMMGAAGWLGAVFLLLFVGAGFAFVFRSEAAALVVGALCCVGAYMIFAAAPKNDLAAQFALAISLAGQCMFIFALHEAFSPSEAPAVFLFEVAVFEAALAALIVSFVHRVWCTIVAAVALSLAISQMGLYGVGSGLMAVALAMLWLEEPQWAPRAALWRPIGYGLVLAFLLPDFSWVGELVDGRPGASVPMPGIMWAKPVLLGGTLIYMAHLLSRDVAAAPTSAGAAIVGAVLIALATSRASGVTSAIIVLVLGFAGGNRALMGLGIAAMLGYLSYFYYSLQATLLEKSLWLAGTGLLLILMWAVMRLTAGKEATRA